MENLIRRVVQIEVAVERNPKHPDFSGLGIIEGGVTTEQGAARVPKFREHVSSRARERANVLKQERPYREEAAK
eukprot:3170794-Lingulodinium_polyedra.AAC.1